MKRDRGRPKITLIELVIKDLLIKEITYNVLLDRIEWRRRIHMTGRNKSVKDP
jgi:hypothetical protein